MVKVKVVYDLAWCKSCCSLLHSHACAGLWKPGASHPYKQRRRQYVYSHMRQASMHA